MPVWSGDPSEFEAFCIACRWYETSLKENERKQAASRVWAKLHGPAKAVVKHLNPEEYESIGGLRKLLEVLRRSPLQELPVPDSFRRLDSWHQLRRQPTETIAQLLVREEDLFTQLQQSLSRARTDRGIGRMAIAPMGPPEVSFRDPPRDDQPASTPSNSLAQSPMVGGQRAPLMADATRSSPLLSTGLAVPAAPATQTTGQAIQTRDFFEDELRGYRLLKAARLSGQEKQNILTQTGNNTSFELIRRALRTLFAEADEEHQHRWRKPRIWYEEGPQDWDEWGQEQWDDASWHADDSGWQEEAYWQDWQEAWFEEPWQEEEWPEPERDEVPVLENETDPQEVQYREAFALATEATKTLAEAREAVRKVRQARGYYAPESASGKGMTKSPTSSPSARFGGKSPGKSYGPCFICGKPSHSYKVCPDRFSKGRSKGKSSFMVESLFML